MNGTSNPHSASATNSSNGTSNSSNGISPSSSSSHLHSDVADKTNNVVVRTTEGWLELFLTTPEKYHFGHWNEYVKDKSLVHQMAHPVVAKLQTFVPVSLAPNCLALFGFASLAQVWYFTYSYGTVAPTACTWMAVVAIVVFFLTNRTGHYHAVQTRQRTALSELFQYSCDCASTVFLSILTAWCLGVSNVESQWYAVQVSQLVLFLKHLSAFHRNAGLRYNVLTGPGEVLVTAVTLLAIRGTLGLDWVLTAYERVVDDLLEMAGNSSNRWVTHHANTRDADKVGAEMIMVAYYSIYVVAVVKSLLLKHPHGWSRFGLSASLLMRLVPALLFRVENVPTTIGVADVICDGLFMAVLTSDITLAKMAGRELHPWVVLMSFAATMSHSTILTLVLTYYIAVFADLCAYLNMPLLTTCRNVYCDGVYDLCHVGHKLLFQNALQYGNRLFVGVVGDKDAMAYKRPPIMSHAERCAEVQACKAVTKVIPNAPCFGLTKEFLDFHQIHVVAYGEEYLERYPDPNDDPYYKVPRLMGIARPLPRTEGLSTSDLIRRIQASAPADEKKSPT
eukprot:CAMPEP_0117011542 /NCGR_PEP_ID=MMETSP0472-20121206/9908_1 /TAXON_ID=693140 ORGANISM="Tiarina fusus, Strain LIS" /NCGR_SAMPLE_ID=MMETSP0472 /ASSEMBLY_ACC=CAM_ASM_000603 /LENGTH=562 /DNA_ID=CAMNT_0004714387 /DNA_START=282 /DNA_END=1970 /DNA_ORIENTATION=-